MLIAEVWYNAGMNMQRFTWHIVLGILIAAFTVYFTQAALPRFFATGSDEKWKQILTEEQFAIMRLGGTERPFTSPLNDEKRPGTYYDATGTQALFRSEDKFDSGTGWPSFTKPINPEAITTKLDWSLGYPRTEVLSSRNGHHLGHVFEDGPEPTGLRYCMNGLALMFVPDEPVANE